MYTSTTAVSLIAHNAIAWDTVFMHMYWVADAVGNFAEYQGLPFSGKCGSLIVHAISES